MYENALVWSCCFISLSVSLCVICFLLFLQAAIAYHLRKRSSALTPVVNHKQDQRAEGEGELAKSTRESRAATGDKSRGRASSRLSRRRSRSSVKQQEIEEEAEERTKASALVHAVKDVNSFVEQEGGEVILSASEKTLRANELLRTHYNLSKY